AAHLLPALRQLQHALLRRRRAVQRDPADPGAQPLVAVAAAGVLRQLRQHSRNPPLRGQGALLRPPDDRAGGAPGDARDGRALQRFRHLCPRQPLAAAEQAGRRRHPAGRLIAFGALSLPWERALRPCFLALGAWPPYPEVPMNVLIVHAHPEPQSFCTAMKDLAVATLSGAGHAVQVSDLYAMNWNPVASAADFPQRSSPDYLVYALEQREAVKAGTLAADIAAELDKLLWADLLILNFPLFWCSVPAMLKGWIDRVLVSGICYGGLRFYDRGGLAGKRALLSFSLGGQRHMFEDEAAVHGDWEPMLRPLQRGTLA